ncbi:haloacid dehalogenase type II [Acidisphaera sp. S103]|uniref:haloacid dehalogenase type II n=1 Tax=Acidisphaera sp. S103 TaxID=1747223 RepID=UPI00131CF8DA|nr:haloacid dehalogenase type II [Acidisphaera sp. S103]
MKLSDFDVLSFDCYGTLIDWESGIYTALAPLLSRAKSGLSRDAVLEAFARLESRQQALTPAETYSDLLAVVHSKLALEWGVAPDPAEDIRFGGSIGDWPAFPDTVEALRTLKQHFQLVILSNVDRASFRATNQRLGVVFDAIYTAQDVGSYKPDPRNFAYLLERMRERGVAKDKLLHVAQSLFHDHVPANGAGLASAWIDRRHDAGGWGATAPVSADVRYDFRFTSLGALAEAHRAGG